MFKGAKTAAYTAQKGYNALMNNKIICISEPSLHILINYMLWMLPRRIVLKMVERMQRIN
jgi:hypothetical protein